MNKDVAAAHEAVKKILASYKKYESPGASDLDNEQPVNLLVSFTLGELRDLDRRFTVR